MKTWGIAQEKNEFPVKSKKGDKIFINSKIKEFLKKYGFFDQDPGNIYFKSDKDYFELKEELNSFFEKRCPFNIIEMKERDMPTKAHKDFFNK